MKKMTYLLQNESIETVLEDVRIFLADLRYEYPRHDEWYRAVAQELRCGMNRKIMIAYDNQNIAGVAILKKGQKEKKICSLRVARMYQGNGIGTSLFKKSLEYLETDKPLLTVSQLKKKEFERIFAFFGFSLEKVYDGKYKPNLCEYCYNGILPQESILRQNEIWIPQREGRSARG